MVSTTGNLKKSLHLFLWYFISSCFQEAIKHWLTEHWERVSKVCSKKKIKNRWFYIRVHGGERQPNLEKIKSSRMQTSIFGTFPGSGLKAGLPKLLLPKGKCSGVQGNLGEPVGSPAPGCRALQH